MGSECERPGSRRKELRLNRWISKKWEDGESIRQDLSRDANHDPLYNDRNTFGASNCRTHITLSGKRVSLTPTTPTTWGGSPLSGSGSTRRGFTELKSPKLPAGACSLREVPHGRLLGLGESLEDRARNRRCPCPSRFVRRKRVRAELCRRGLPQPARGTDVDRRGRCDGTGCGRPQEFLPRSSERRHAGPEGRLGGNPGKVARTRFQAD